MVRHANTEEKFAQAVAGELRAEFARRGRTYGAYADARGINAGTAGRRLSGDVPLSVVELYWLTDWLGISAAEFMARVESGAPQAAAV